MSTEADELITQEIVEAAERVIAEVGRAADANFACPLGAMEVALKAVAPMIAARAVIRSRGEPLL
jgi:hypothetical protein